MPITATIVEIIQKEVNQIDAGTKPTVTVNSIFKKDLKIEFGCFLGIIKNTQSTFGVNLQDFDPREILTVQDLIKLVTIRADQQKVNLQA